MNIINKHYTELSTLRFLAIILIVNSHLNLFYEYEYFATGGAFGNSLFFFISGICLSISLNKNRIPFFHWLKIRYLRIYPKLLFIVIFFISIGFFKIDNIQEFLLKILFPLEFWFLPALMFFYILIYSMIIYFNDFLIKLSLIFILIFYCIGYYFFIDKNSYNIENVILFKSVFYFFVMIMGVLIYRKYNFFNFNPIFSLLVFIFSFTSYYFIKFIMLKYEIYYLQFFEHILILLMVLSLFSFLKNKKVLIIQEIKFINYLILFISSLSLEIYLVHVYFAKFPLSFFPINFILFIIFVSFFAFLLNKFFLMLKLK
jgi:hypothetical protein